MTSHRQEELQRVAAQAAEWLVSLDDGAKDEHPELAEWLLESPLHTEMFLRAATIDREAAQLSDTALARLDSLPTPSPAKVLQLTDALTRGASRSAAPPTKGLPTHAHRGRYAAAVGILLVAALGWWAHSRLAWQRYGAEIGEQRSIMLADGTLMRLNTRSWVQVRYSRDAREVRLVSGEALFTVQRDSSRPFRVQVGDATVTALGTEFNVYRRPTETRVTVIEGAVEISGGGSRRLAAGEAAVVTTRGRIEPQKIADIAQATAWRRHQLVFERASLDDIAMEFNRYNRSPQLRVAPQLAQQHRYTAVFNADDPGLLLKFIARDPQLRMSREGDELLIAPR